MPRSSRSIAILFLGMFLCCTSLVHAQHFPVDVQLRVVDDVTDKPIDTATAVPMSMTPDAARKEAHWDEIVEIRGGEGRFKVMSLPANYSEKRIVRVYAPGYLPNETLPITPGIPRLFEMRMTPAPKRLVKLVGPDNQAIAGARILFLPSVRGSSVNLKPSELIGFAEDMWTAVTDESGVATFSLPVGAYCAAAATPDGYATFELAEAGEPEVTVQFKPWASLTVTFENVRRDPVNRFPPAASVSMDTERDTWATVGARSEYLDAQNTATIRHLMEGPITVGLYQVNNTQDSSSGVRLGRITLMPGEHRNVRYTVENNSIRGKIVTAPGVVPEGMEIFKSRMVPAGANEPLFFWVQGSVRPVLQTPFPMPADIDTWDLPRVTQLKETWRTLPEYRAYLDAFTAADPGHPAASFKVEADGRFAVDSLPSGPYELTAFGRLEYLDTKLAKSFYSAQLIKLENEQTLDVGDFLLKGPDPLVTGLPAPKLSCPTLNLREKIDLESPALRGKCVLLHFWKSTYARSTESIPQLVEMRNHFAGTGKFEIVSLSSDNHPIDAYEYVRRSTMPWPQGFIGPGSGSSAMTDYLQPPHHRFILLDSDHRIARSNLTLEELLPLIQQTIDTRISRPPPRE